jgi:peptidoglycan/xylan/chitin deacetylase (PgdA/CDA1 family)
MDHDRYTWFPLVRRPPVAWPNGARVALVVMPSLQWFPLDMPAGLFPPIGTFEAPYPDLRAYSHRDYGNRVGIFRIMAVLDRLAIPASVPTNAAIAQRYPDLLAEVVRRRWEVVAYGRHMGQSHHAGLERAAEAAIVDEVLAMLRRASGQPVGGWLSPGGTESPHTLDLLAERGVTYVLDWANDELPYPLRTAAGRLHAMPYGHDLSDARIIWQDYHTTEEFADAVLDAYRTLDQEAMRQGGRLLTIAVHPWLIGQPHRIATFERLLATLVRQPRVWPATATEVLTAFTRDQVRVP